MPPTMPAPRDADSERGGSVFSFRFPVCIQRVRERRGEKHVRLRWPSFVSCFISLNIFKGSSCANTVSSKTCFLGEMSQSALTSPSNSSSSFHQLSSCQEGSSHPPPPPPRALGGCEVTRPFWLGRCDCFPPMFFGFNSLFTVIFDAQRLDVLPSSSGPTLLPHLPCVAGKATPTLRPPFSSSSSGSRVSRVPFSPASGRGAAEWHGPERGRGCLLPDCP